MPAALVRAATRLQDLDDFQPPLNAGEFLTWNGTAFELSPAGGGVSIGGGVTGGTAGSVLFVGAGGVLAQDNANLFWDDAANTFRVGGTANSVTLAGAATANPVTVTATGTDASVPIRLAPKGPQGFIQAGPDTYGAIGWAGLNVALEIVRFESTEASVQEVYVESVLGDFAGHGGSAFSGSLTNQAGGAEDGGTLLGMDFSVASLLGTGRTTDALIGISAAAQNGGAGTTTEAFGLSALALASAGVIGNAYGCQAEVQETGSGQITNAFAFHAPEITGAVTNASAFWYDAAGVFRIDGAGVLAAHNPAFTKYTPGAANFERAVLQWDTNVAELGTEAGGTGVLRALSLLGTQVLFPDGTQALPGMAFASDPDTGWYRVAANRFRFVTAGNTRVDISDDSFLTFITPQTGGGGLDFQVGPEMPVVYRATANADSGTTTIQSPLVSIYGKYWNGASSVNSSLAFDVFVPAPTERTARFSFEGTGRLLISHANGNVTVASDTNSPLASQFGVISGAAGRIGEIIRGHASQSANLTEWQDSSAVVLGSVSASGAALFRPLDAVTNAVTLAQTLGHHSTGTPAAGFGGEQRFTLESSTTENREAGGLEWSWATATDASRKARVRMLVYDTAVREAWRIESDGSNPMVGFLGAAAVPRTAAWTPTNVSTDRSFDCNATTLDEVADCLATLVGDLQAFGLLG